MFIATAANANPVAPSERNVLWGPLQHEQNMSLLRSSLEWLKLSDPVKLLFAKRSSYFNNSEPV